MEKQRIKQNFKELCMSLSAKKGSGIKNITTLFSFCSVLLLHNPSFALDQSSTTSPSSINNACEQQDDSLQQKSFLRGPRGHHGKRGRKGKHGEHGHQGLRGANGKRGIDGPPGASGSPGDIGSPGPTGPTGEPGNLPTTPIIYGIANTFTSSQVFNFQTGGNEDPITVDLSTCDFQGSGVSLNGSKDAILIETDGTYEIEYSINAGFLAGAYLNPPSLQMFINHDLGIIRYGIVPLTQSWLMDSHGNPMATGVGHIIMILSSGDELRLQLYAVPQASPQTLAFTTMAPPILIPPPTTQVSQVTFSARWIFIVPP
jgi:hypothetical protein